MYILTFNLYADFVSAGYAQTARVDSIALSEFQSSRSLYGLLTGSPCVYSYVCVYSCTHIQTYIYMFIHIHTLQSSGSLDGLRAGAVNIYMCTCVCVCACIYMYNVYVHSYIVCIYIYVQCVYIYIYIYIYIYLRFNRSVRVPILSLALWTTYRCR